MSMHSTSCPFWFRKLLQLLIFTVKLNTFFWGWCCPLTYSVTCLFVFSLCKEVGGEFPSSLDVYTLLILSNCHHQLFPAFKLLLKKWSSKAFLMGTHTGLQLIVMGLAWAHTDGICMVPQGSKSSVSVWTCKGVSTFLAIAPWKCDQL